MSCGNHQQRVAASQSSTKCSRMEHACRTGYISAEADLRPGVTHFFASKHTYCPDLFKQQVSNRTKL